jgi:hypothetical protein
MMLWLPVLLLTPLAALKLRTRMEGPCDRPERYETKEDALEAIKMPAVFAMWLNQVGSIPVSLCSDCDGYHTWRYRFPVND